MPEILIKGLRDMIKYDIVLINPYGAHGIYGSLGSTLVAVEPPMWLRLNAGYLRTNKNRIVGVIDAECERLSAKEVAERVEEMAPTLVGILAYGHQPSASTQSLAGAREVITAIKNANPERRIAIAGGHVSSLPDRTLAEELVDYVIIGEGPYGFEELLSNLPDERKIIRTRALDVTEIIDQAWDYTPPSNYVAHNWHALGDGANRSPYASVGTTFNCPWNCSFCCISAPFGAPGYKMRSPTTVIDEIEFLVKEHSVRYIKIIDEMFILRPSHYLEIANGLIKRNLGDKINVWCYSRIDTVRPDTLTILRKSGIRWLALGIESGSAHVRDGASKRLRTDDIVGTVRTIQEHDINVIGNFIFGLRDDTMETMQQTLDLALECRPEWANFYSCMAYPGSALYTQALAEGWTLPISWRGFSQHNDDSRPLDTQHISGAEVLRFRDAAFRTFFSDPTYRAHVARRFGAEGIAEIDRMLEYKLTRKLFTGEIS